MLKVAVVDSGINAGHSHVGRVEGGVSLVSESWNDLIGHGTAVAAAIRDLEPRVDLYAVKIFDRSFATEIDVVVKALEWCVDNEMDVVNLSLATAKIAHADTLREPSRRVNVLVAPADFIGLPAYPGSFSWAFGVSADSTCPRSDFRVAPGGKFLASPFPRSIPGLTSDQNFAGTSFASANLTGLICSLMLAQNIRTRDAVLEILRRNTSL